MLNDKKVQLLEIALAEGGITLDYGLEVYSSRSNVSRAVADLETNEFLIEKKPPNISSFRKVWTPTDKTEKVLE